MNTSSRAPFYLEDESYFVNLSSLASFDRIQTYEPTGLA